MCKKVTNDFGEKLKIARKKSDMNQQELAELVRVSRRTIMRYESGAQIPNNEIRKKIESVLTIEKIIVEKEIDFSMFISDFRKKYQMSQMKLAQMLEVSKMAISRYENGSRKPSDELRSRIMNLMMNFENTDYKTTKDSISFPIVDKKQMGERIHFIRKRRNESLQELGKSLTILSGKNVVSRWEKGKNIPEIEKLMNLAFLGNSFVSEILYGKEYKYFLLTSNKTLTRFDKLDTKKLGMRLRKIRKDFKQEREDFGKLFFPCINKSSMDRYENGKDIPNAERLVQYAYLGKVSLSFLIYGI